MDLTYSDADESFRKEIRAWLEENLPAGWLEPGFAMTVDERKSFNAAWPGSGADRGVRPGQGPVASRLLR
jgi:hypothetical protein